MDSSSSQNSGDGGDDAPWRLKRKCGGCQALDHDARNCPKLGRPPKGPPPRTKRNRRRSRPRAVTLSVKRMGLKATMRDALSVPDTERAELEAARPRTRGDCRDAQRPCPFVACKHHLYLEVNPQSGSIKINFPDLEPWELAETCALDVAERGAITLEEVGQVSNLTRERVRQLEVRGLLKLRDSAIRLRGE